MKSKAEMMKALRKKKAESGLKELRGVFVPASEHDAIKQQITDKYKACLK